MQSQIIIRVVPHMRDLAKNARTYLNYKSKKLMIHVGKHMLEVNEGALFIYHYSTDLQAQYTSTHSS